MNKRKVRRYLVVTMAVLALLLAACGNKTDRNAAAPASPGASAPSESASSAPSETVEPSGAAEAQTLTITHALGTTEVRKNPKKVIVFDFGILDTLDKMGVEVLGVAKDSLPPYLEKFKDARYENIGSLKEPDLEKISGLEPDLIVISGRQSDYYEELSKLGPTVYLGLDTSRYWDSFRENMRTVASIFDRTDWMEQEMAQIEAKVEAIKTKAGAQDKKGLIVLVTGGKLSAYGPGGRFGIIHDVLGIPAADPNIEVSTHGMSVSYEYIAEKNPDYLFVVDRDQAVGSADAQGQSAAQVLDNELVRGTNAYKNGKIIYLDPEYWYLSGGGLVSVSAMVDEVAQDLGLN